jgi:hypothetical protein
MKCTEQVANLDMVIAMMYETHVPKHFWAEAVMIATYLIKRFPSSVTKEKPPFTLKKDKKLLTFIIEYLVVNVACSRTFKNNKMAQ